MKLLIVDDSSKFRVLLKSICRDLFEEIIECEDGDQAVEICKQEKPDFVLMDIKMKRVNGLSATRQIKEFLPAIQVIILSQFRDQLFIDEAFSVGALGYVNKENISAIETIIKETGAFNK